MKASNELCLHKPLDQHIPPARDEDDGYHLLPIDNLGLFPDQRPLFCHDEITLCGAGLTVVHLDTK